MNEFERERFAGLIETITQQGEPVTVLFSDGSTRLIYALVYRERIVKVPEARETDRPVITLVFANDPHAATMDGDAVECPGGIGLTETLFDRNTTRFQLPRRIGLDASLMDGKGFKIKNIPVQLECGMLVEL